MDKVQLLFWPTLYVVKAYKVQTIKLAISK